jgi:hypothetical protein
MKRRIAQRAPKSMLELKQMLIEEWAALDQSMIDHMVKSTPSRFKICIEEKGASIGHLLNYTQTGTVERKAAQPRIQKGVVIPRTINLTSPGSVIRCSGHIKSTSTVQGMDHPSFYVKIQDPPHLIPAGLMPRSVVLLVHTTQIEEWEIGKDVIFDAKIVLEPAPSLRYFKGSRGCSSHFKRFLHFQRPVEPEEDHAGDSPTITQIDQTVDGTSPEA